MKRIDLTKIDWVKIQSDHDSGLNFCEIVKLHSISKTVLHRASVEGFFRRNKPINKMTTEKRKLASERMKKMRAEGIGNLTHRKSIPCEELKRNLKEKGFVFSEEFRPLENRLFRLDIAFPEKKIAIEVNGNQHYENRGKLKPYYQERHDLIESAGWKLQELHYSLCFDEDFINSFLVQWIRTSAS